MSYAAIVDTHRFTLQQRLELARSVPTHSETERLMLRPLAEQDVDARYLAWFADDEVTRWLEARNIAHEEAVAFMRVGEETGRYRVFAICDKATGLHIGNIKFGDIQFEHGVSDLVTVIGDRSYWGRGYATEAIRLGNTLAFASPGLRKLSGAIYSENIGSIKAYVRAGWIVEGVLRGHLVRDGRIQDRVLVSCFNPAYFPTLPANSHEAWMKTLVPGA